MGRKRTLRVNARLVARDSDFRALAYSRIRRLIDQYVTTKGTLLLDLYHAIRKEEGGRATMWMSLNDLAEVCKQHGCPIEQLAGKREVPWACYKVTGHEVVHPRREPSANTANAELRESDSRQSDTTLPNRLDEQVISYRRADNVVLPH